MQMYVHQQYTGTKKERKKLHRVDECACVCVCVLSHSVIPNSLQLPGLYPSMLLCPRDFPGKNTGVGCHFFLPRIFPTQGSNPCLLHWQADSLPLIHQGSQRVKDDAINLVFHHVPSNSIFVFVRGPQLCSVLNVFQKQTTKSLGWCG